MTDFKKMIEETFAFVPQKIRFKKVITERIPLKLDNNISRIKEMQFAYNKDFSVLIVPEGVKRIEARAFEGCSRLVLVILPSSLDIIEKLAFKNCHNLVRVVMPSCKTIENHAFCFCENLQFLELPENLKNLSLNCFYENSKLHFSLPYGIEKIIEVEPSILSNIDFKEYYKNFYVQNDLLISRNSHSVITLIKPDVTEISVPEGIEIIGEHAFYHSKINKISLPSSLRRIEKCAFFSCNELKEIALPEDLEFIGENAFFYCRKIESITIPRRIEKIYDSTFHECKNLKEINLPKRIRYIGKSAFAACGFEKLDFSDYSFKIDDYAFSYCKKLHQAILPKYGILGDFVFRYCESLVAATIPLNIEFPPFGLFHECKNLREVLFPKYPKNINDKYCYENLEIIYLPEQIRKVGLWTLDCFKDEKVTKEWVCYHDKYDEIVKNGFRLIK